jgi:predicted regulator of Ras-like GTPase activity (Roadblock/LC7/MglB family)
MQAVLSQLNTAVPGVVGSMLCDGDGQLLAQAFPPTFDTSRLKEAAAVLADRAAALGTVLGTVGTLDLRYASTRIVVKAADGVRLLFVCAPNVNLPLLSLSASGAIRRLEQRAAPAVAAAQPAPAAPAGELYRAVQQIDALIARSKGDAFKLRGQIALKAGFTLDLVDPETPDDPERLQKLKAAASAVLGQRV